jgi:hypothetical protein
MVDKELSAVNARIVTALRFQDSQDAGRLGELSGREWREWRANPTSRIRASIARPHSRFWNARIEIFAE